METILETLERDPELARTAVRYRRHRSGLSPWCWEIVQVKDDKTETTAGPYTADELGPALRAIQRNGTAPDAASEPGAEEAWEKVVERGWLRRIDDAVHRCAHAGRRPIPLPETAKDHDDAKKGLSELLEATDAYMAWCRDD